MLKALDIYRQGFQERFLAGTLPEFVQNACLLDKQAAIDLPGKSFADPPTRNFPLDSKASTWMSMAFLADHPRYRTPTLRGMVDKAAAMWEITDREKELAEAAPLKKIAAAPAAEGSILFVDSLTGLEHTTFIRTEHELKRAADYLLTKRASFSYPTRERASRDIIGIARRAFPTALDGDRLDMLRKVAGIGTSTPVELNKAVIIRKPYAKNPDSIELLGALLKHASFAAKDEQPILKMSLLRKIAGTLDLIDKLDGLTQRGIPHPEDHLFRIPPSVVTATTREFACAEHRPGMQLSKVATDLPRIQSYLKGVHQITVRTPEEAQGELGRLTPLQRARALCA